MSNELIAGIELGGTKTICLVGQRGQLASFEKKIIPTTSPNETLDEVATFLQTFPKIASIGVGAFGPVDIVPGSNNYGALQNTPKPGWKNFNIYTYFSRKFQCPVIIDTDVNAAALAEYTAGAGKDLNNFIYVTVGTGIGGSAFIDGKALKGRGHPEMGHIALPRDETDLAFTSACPFHANCAEGLASGKAIAMRWGKPLNQFPKDSAPWALQARYLSQFYHNLMLLFSPQRIICGGGVSSEALLKQVRQNLISRINGYVHGINAVEDLQDYLVLPALEGDAGPLGSFLLNQYAP